MDPVQIQQQIDSLSSQVKTVQGQLTSHYHNGFDSNQIAWSDLYQKKVYIRHTIYGADAATTANYGVFFIVPIACLVTAFKEVHETAGTDAGAVTIDLEKLTGTTAPGSGSSVLSSTLSLKATANTVQSATITSTSANKTLAIGDRLALKRTGTLTSVAGVTVHVEITF